MTTGSLTTDWCAMPREELDRGLNNAAAVANSAALVADWDARSARLRALHPEHLDLRYGSRERNRIDFIKAADGAPTVAFIHGGYWQTRAKETFTAFAAGPLAHGINVALVGYTLAPEASMDEIVGEVSASLDFLADRLPALGADPSRIVVSGWSAGGHLTAMTLAHPHVKGGIAISGLFDLEPVRHSYLNDRLGLDEAASRRNSPQMHSEGADKPLVLVVGGDELPILRQQTRDYAAHRAHLGLPLVYEEIAGADHFTIMNEMAEPTGCITMHIRQLAERVAR